MPRDHDDHLPGLFKLEIEGLDVGSFQEATLPAMETESIEYRHGASTSPFKRPGLGTLGTLTLRRGIVKGSVLQEWQEHVARGQQDRRAISVILLNAEGEEMLRWNMVNCWPVKYSAPDDSTETNEHVVEAIEIVVEHME